MPSAISSSCGDPGPTSAWPPAPGTRTSPAGGRPRPDFRLALGVETPNVPRGGTALVPVQILRLDGFDGPVDVEAGGLPPGVVATPARIEPGAYSADLLLTADATAPALTPPT